MVKKVVAVGPRRDAASESSSEDEEEKGLPPSSEMVGEASGAASRDEGVASRERGRGGWRQVLRQPRTAVEADGEECRQWRQIMYAIPEVEGGATFEASDVEAPDYVPSSSKEEKTETDGSDEEESSGDSEEEGGVEVSGSGSEEYDPTAEAALVQRTRLVGLPWSELIVDKYDILT